METSNLYSSAETYPASGNRRDKFDQLRFKISMWCFVGFLQGMLFAKNDLDLSSEDHHPLYVHI